MAEGGARRRSSSGGSQEMPPWAKRSLEHGELDDGESEGEATPERPEGGREEGDSRGAPRWQRSARWRAMNGREGAARPGGHDGGVN